MLVRNSLKIEESCPRRWSMLAAAMLLSAGVIAAGVGLTKAAAADEDKKADAQPAAKPDEKKDDKKTDKKDDKKPQKKDDLIPGFPDIDELLKRLPPGLDEETLKMIRQQMEMTRKMMEQMNKRNPGGFGGIGGLPGGGLIPFPQIPMIPQIPQLGRLPGFPGTGMTEARLGAMLSKPTGAMVDQLDLPKDQGLVIEELRDDSAAAKAGLKRHDILLEIDGKAVASDPAEFLKQLSSIKSDKAVDAVVMRKSKKETVKGLKLPEAKDLPGLQPLNPFNFQFNGFGGQGGGTTIQRDNDSFTAKNVEKCMTITVKGTIEEGKAKVSEITIDDGKKPQKYESLDKVPADHKAKVQSLIKAGEGGRVRNFRLGR